MHFWGAYQGFPKRLEARHNGCLLLLAMKCCQHSKIITIFTSHFYDFHKAQNVKPLRAEIP